MKNMSFSDPHEKMTLAEQHGIQLRQATDVLEGVSELLENDAAFFVFMAEDLLADIIATNKLLQSS
jgi:hypothetical protein